jgi:hypothetical protein
MNSEAVQAAIPPAERARVTAIGNDALAVEAVRRTQASTQGLEPLDVEVRDLFRRPPAPEELNRFDATG